MEMNGEADYTWSKTSLTKDPKKLYIEEVVEGVHINFSLEI